ncbi:hypothetical protein OG851_39410 [Streptomyces sp. NBC_00161]
MNHTLTRLLEIVPARTTVMVKRHRYTRSKIFPRRASAKSRDVRFGIR